MFGGALAVLVGERARCCECFGLVSCLDDDVEAVGLHGGDRVWLVGDDRGVLAEEADAVEGDDGVAVWELGDRDV